MNKVILDTNVFMMNPEVLLEYIDDNELIICSVVLEELDNLKMSENATRAYNARKGIKFIMENQDKFHYIINDVVCNISLTSGYDLNKNDNRILGACIRENAMICSLDQVMHLKARDLGIEIFKIEVESVDNRFYKGYKVLSGDTHFINNLFQDIEDGNNSYGFTVNEYLILKNTDLDNVIEYRFDGEKFVDLRLPPSKNIKGINSLQRCCLDLLNNVNIPIKIIMGTYGSGKTYLSTRMALYNTMQKGYFGKILVVREVVGEGMQIGYLPGEFENKTKEFFKPFEQCLENGEFELQSLIQRGVLEKNIPYFIKGTTYNHTIVLCDEASDLNIKQLKLIGTRLGENSNIVFMGDYKQSVYDSSTNNGLIQLTNKLKGQKLFGTITLQEDVRSEASKIFAELD